MSNATNTNKNYKATIASGAIIAYNDAQAGLLINDMTNEAGGLFVKIDNTWSLAQANLGFDINLTDDELNSIYDELVAKYRLLINNN